MAYTCISCGKKPQAGKTISHSHRVTRRRFSPNLQRVKINIQGRISREYVCTVCLKSGKVKKAV